MMEHGAMARETGAVSDLLQLTEQLNTLEPVRVAPALERMYVNGLPLTTQQAVQLRENNAVPTLVVLLEPSYDVILRSHVLHVVDRMCRLDHALATRHWTNDNLRDGWTAWEQFHGAQSLGKDGPYQCQDSFINHGVIRKLIKNADTSQECEVDAPAAIRALARLAGGQAAGPAQIAAVEDVFLSGLIPRMRGELATRCHKLDEPLVQAIGDFLAAVAACPAHHIMLRDASLLPLLPTLLESAAVAAVTAAATGSGSGSGSGSGAAFLDVVYNLSTCDAVAPSMRTESYFEALVGMLSAVPAMSPSRRTTLLALCNVFGADADNVRAEEVLRVNGAPPLLTALLVAALGPADVGAAARATGAAPAPAVGAAGGGGGGLQRRSGGLNGNRDGAAAATTAGRLMRVSDGGRLTSARASNNGGGGATALDATVAMTIPGHERQNETTTVAWQVRTMPAESLSAAAAAGSRKGAGTGYALTSITAPGFGGGGGSGGGGGGRTPQPSTDRNAASAAGPPIPLEAVLHSLKCMAANPMLARKLAKPGSPAYVLPSLLDAVVSSLQHHATGDITRDVWAARAAAGAQTLLRLASCAELVPALRAAGAAAVLRLLALEADDPRVGEAACGALLYMGDTGLVGYTSRLAVAAFRALYRNGAAAGGSEPELGNRFQVFVSHHRADAQHFAMFTLHPMLVLQGVPAFIDSQHRTASSDWAHMIACCKNMVVVMSEMLLASPEHVREVEAALTVGLNVVVVVPEGARWTDSHGNKSFDSPPPAVLLALPASVRGLFADNTLPYSADGHEEFMQRLMARLQLPATAGSVSAGDGAAEAVTPPLSTSPGRGGLRHRGIDGSGGGGANGSDTSRGPSRGPSRGRGVWTGRGDTPGGDDQPPHRVSFGGVGDDFQRLQRQQNEEERAELAGMGTRPAAAAAAGPYPVQQPPQAQLLPWPWNRLLAGNMAIGSDDEDEPVRYPRTVYGYGYGNGTGSLGASLGGAGGGVVGEPWSGSAVRESAAGMAQHTAALPTAGAPASYASRRYMMRQRSSINRQAALQLQQQQQLFMVQQQWLHEYQQQAVLQQQRLQQLQLQLQQLQPSLMGSSSSGALATDDGLPSYPQGGGGASDVPGAAVAGVGAATAIGGGDMAASLSTMSQLMALQLEMVRYEVRQAVQASHDNITYKIDRLRSDFTEQVVQLRFDLAGKIEALHEALTKATTIGSSGVISPRELGDAASGGTVVGGSGSGGGNGSGVGGGSGGSNREMGSALSPGPQQQQQLAAALSNSLTATMQEAVNRAVAQLQTTIASAGPGCAVKPQPQPPPPTAAAVLGGVTSPTAPSSTAAVGPNNAVLPKGHQGGVGMSATAAAAQQGQGHHLGPQPGNHPRAYGGGGGGGGGGGASTVTIVAPQTPHHVPGTELLSPMARAGAAAWSGDGGVSTAGAIHAPGHGGGGKSRNSHAPVPNGTYAGGGKGGVGAGGGAVATPLPARPGPLAMFDAAAAADDDGGNAGTGMDGRLMSPTALIATVNSPATAQAAILLAARTRPHIPPTQAPSTSAGGGGGGGSGGSGASSLKERNGANGLGGGGGGKGTLPPLAGLLPPFSHTSAGKLMERTDVQPVRKAQQQLVMMQQ